MGDKMDLMGASKLKENVTGIFEYLKEAREEIHNLTLEEMIEQFGKEGAERIIAEMEYITIILQGQVIHKKLVLKRGYEKNDIDLTLFMYRSTHKILKTKKTDQQIHGLKRVLEEWGITEENIERCCKDTKGIASKEVIDLKKVRDALESYRLEKSLDLDYTDNKIQELRESGYLKVKRESDISLKSEIFDKPPKE